MKIKTISTTTDYTNLIRLAIIVGLLLLIPLVAMQFTQEVNWTLFDFMFAGTLLFGTGATYELIAKRSKKLAYRAGFGLALIASFLLVWVNGAVGIIGDENPANLLYLFVPMVGLIGSIITLFQSRGMMWTALAAALVQALIPIVSLFLWSPQYFSWAPGVLFVFVLNSFFVMMFVGSALLFRQAGSTTISTR